jgi:hypothetical protein
VLPVLLQQGAGPGDMAALEASPLYDKTDRTDETLPSGHPITAAAPIPGVLSVSSVLSDGGDPATLPSAPPPSRRDDDPFRHGRSVTGSRLTWTGRVVSLDAWRNLSEWERHGSTGKVFNGLTGRWERTLGGT